jgi:hypothetical protein
MYSKRARIRISVAMRSRERAIRNQCDECCSYGALRDSVPRARDCGKTMKVQRTQLHPSAEILGAPKEMALRFLFPAPPEGRLLVRIWQILANTDPHAAALVQ